MLLNMAQVGVSSGAFYSIVQTLRMHLSRLFILFYLFILFIYFVLRLLRVFFHTMDPSVKNIQCQASFHICDISMYELCPLST